MIGDVCRLNRKGHPWHRHHVKIVAAMGCGYVVMLRNFSRGDDATAAGSISVREEELSA